MYEVIVKAGVFGVLIPALVAGLVMLSAWRPWSESAPERSPWGGAMGVLVGFHVGYISLNWDSGAVVDSLVGLVGEPKQMGIAVGIAAVVAVVESLFERRSWLRGAVFVAALVGATYLIAGDLVGQTWSVSGSLLRIGVVVVAFGAMSLSFEAIDRKHPGSTVPIVLTLLGTGAALMLALNGTARVAQHLGILTATAGASVVAAWWRGSFQIGAAGIRVYLLLCATLYAAGYFYIFEAPLVGTLVLAAAPHALWLQKIGPSNQLEGWKATLARVMFVAVAIGTAILVAWPAGGGSSYGY